MRVLVRAVPDSLPGGALSEAARALLGRLLREAYGLSEYRLEKTALGAPVLSGDGPRVSLSHTGGLVCCAVSERPVGVDAERADRFLRRPVSPAVLERVCTARERREIAGSADPAAAFLMRWVLKESASKARGVGFTEGFQKYEITFSPDGPVCPGFALKLRRFAGFWIGAAEET